MYDLFTNGEYNMDVSRGIYIHITHTLTRTITCNNNTNNNNNHHKTHDSREPANEKTRNESGLYRTNPKQNNQFNIHVQFVKCFSTLLSV